MIYLFILYPIYDNKEHFIALHHNSRKKLNSDKKAEEKEMIKTDLTKVAKRSIHRNKIAFCMKEKGPIPII